MGGRIPGIGPGCRIKLKDYIKTSTQKKEILFSYFFFYINRNRLRQENMCISSLLLVWTCIRHISLTSYFNLKTETFNRIMIDNIDQNRLAVSNIHLGPFRMGFFKAT
jgi:hypothetical protein